jgi:prevent-host-death family protein
MKKTQRTIKPTAKVSELKAGLSAYLARVKAGEEVVVTERGRPVAKLVPIPPTEDAEVERLQRLEAEGLIKLGTGRIPDDFWEMPRPNDPEGLVLKALLEEREEGR